MKKPKPGTLLEAVARARDQRHLAERDFRDALRRAHRSHSWGEIAAVAGLHRSHVRYLALDLNERRRQKREETHDDNQAVT